MKTTVYVPCSDDHFFKIYLDRVIENYITGTELPDEILVDISFADIDRDQSTAAFINRFNLEVMRGIKLTVCDTRSPWKSQKCNKLKELKFIGDIVIFNDADDVPHPSRVEVIKKIFDQRTDALLLNHNYWMVSDIDKHGFEKLKDLTFKKNKEIKIIEFDVLYNYIKNNPDCVYGQNVGFRVGDGFMAMKRYVVERYSWPEKKRGADALFCKNVTLKENKSLIIDTPIYYYYR